MNRSKFIPSACALAVLAGLLVTLSAGAQKRDSTFLGVVRADGTLVPIAVTVGEVWWNRWPWLPEGEEIIESLAVPATLEDIPPAWLPPNVQLPTIWRLHRASAAPVRVRLRQPVRPFAWNVMSTVAIRTDYPAPKSVSQSEDVGIAIAGPGELGSFVPASRNESRRILSALAKRLLAVEQDALASWRRAWPEEIHKSSPPALTRTFRDGEHAGPEFHLRKASRRYAGRIYYHLDGEKLYLLGKNDAYSPGCKLNLSFEGIVITRADGRLASERLFAFAFAEYCGDRASRTEPLATLEWKNRLLWVVSNNLEDGYEYGLLDPDAYQPITLQGAWELRR